ncbi:MAG: PaaI family thioesterase [Spirochaetes bacterium]|nr:PaaI family thioesterase [Spirochaetota bacterium]MBX3722357.1 PaaI family thioesterase [Turneriella sp.]
MAQSFGKTSTVGQQLHHSNCLACGALNNYSFHIPSTFNEQKGEVEFSYQLRREHEGAPGHAHGGALALILDEAQGVLCHHLGHFVMTDGFSIKYHKATPLYKDLRIVAWLTSARSKRLYTKARIYLGDELLVESKIKWYIIPERLLERRFSAGGNPGIMLKDFLEPNRVRAKEIRRRLRAEKKAAASS